MGKLDWLKAAPHQPSIGNEDLIRKNYRYWRIRIFYGMYVGYIFYYFTRKSLTFAMPAMMADLGYNKTDLGILASILSLTYGLSKFVSGVLSDRANPRFFMSIGLIMTGCINVFFGLSSSLIFFILFWGVNGFFQGWGWPPCARLLTHWYSQKERGTWWGFWNTSHNIGGAVISVVAAACAQCLGWRYGMYLPGLMCIGVGFFIMNRLRDTPQSLGLPPIEKYKNDPIHESGQDRELTTKQILVKYLLQNKYIWILAVAYFFVYIIRTAINDWSALYLVEVKGYSLVAAGTCIFFFEIGGMLGSLAAGLFSDRIFKGRRGPVNALFSFAAMAAVAGFWLMPATGLFLNAAMLFGIGFLIFGPQMLIGIAAAELSSKRAAGSATGFVGLFAYIGAATAGMPLGMMAENWGWQGFFIAVAVCAAISGMLLLPLWSVKYNPAFARADLPPAAQPGSALQKPAPGQVRAVVASTSLDLSSSSSSGIAQNTVETGKEKIDAQ